MKTTAKRLIRSKTDRLIGGVCGGLGKYFDIEPWIFRIVFLILLFNGSGFLIYLILWIIVPEEGEEARTEFKDQAKNGATGIAHDIGDLTQNKSNLPAVIGAVILLVGLALLFNNFSPVPIEFGKLWPVVLIVLGIIILFRPTVEDEKEDEGEKEKAKKESK
jgi:phage shock protein C